MLTRPAEVTKIARKQQIRLEGDLLSYPRYSIEDASRYLKIPVKQPLACAVCIVAMTLVQYEA